MKSGLTVALSALGIAGALVLSGCATRNDDEAAKKKGLVPDVTQTVDASGDKLVSVPPYRASCGRGQHDVPTSFQCPVLAADWTSKRSGVARLTIGVPDLKNAEISGADFHLGSSEVVRVRVKSSTQPDIKEYPASSFDVPLNFVEKLAYGPRSWVRVYHGDRYIDANLNSGESTGKAVESMAHFMKVVGEVSGRAPSAAARAGGLFDRLGIGDDDKPSSSKGVEGMHPR